MTNNENEPDRPGAGRADGNADPLDADPVDPGSSAQVRERMAQLLTDLANDPQAPPSRVTAMSVIAAAKAAAAEPGDDPDTAHQDEVIAPGAERPTAEVMEFRPRRRRFVLAGLVAAAALAGISVLAVSLTVAGGSSTSTSADGARAASTQAASADNPTGAAGAAAPPAAAPEIAQSPALSELQQAAGAASDDSVAGSLAGGSADSASGSSAAAGATAGDATAGDASAGCWPPLGDPALTALTDALPPGAYRSPLALTADCEPAAVGGAILPGTAPGTVLVVRVSNAVPAACNSDTSSGTACTATGDGLYLAEDASGSAVVYAYGNGKQVVVSGWPASGDSVAISSGLTVEQSAAAARAVLGAIG